MRRKKDSLGLFQALLFGTMFYVVVGLDSTPMGSPHAFAQNAALPFRPIGSESAVDRYPSNNSPRQNTTNNPYRGNTNPSQFRETGYQPAPQRDNRDVQIRQVAMQSGGFALPPEGNSAPANGNSQMSGPSAYAAPPLNTPPQLLPGESRPPAQAPPQSTGPLPPAPNLQTAPRSNPPQFSPPPNTNPQSQAGPPRTLPNSSTPPTPPIADYQPLAPPQLSNGGFATMSDCRLITPPSDYRAMSPYAGSPYAGGCGSVTPVAYADPYVPPPAQIYAPAAMPTYAAPVGSAAIGPAAPVGSRVTFGQETYPVQVGQGLWGQPTAYVPGQRFRNWLRYFSF